MDQFRFRARFVAVLVTSLALFGALSLSALAAPGGGNSAGSAACEEGGYLDWTDAAGNAFKNEGACIRYAAQGGQLVAVVGEPNISVSTTALDGNPSACLLTVSVANYPAGSYFPTFQGYWNIGGVFQIHAGPWTSSQAIVVDASGTGSLNFISANGPVLANGDYFANEITVGDLVWGPDLIAC